MLEHDPLDWSLRYSLWQSDRTGTGAVRVADLQSPEKVGVISNGRLFFSDVDPTHGRELWAVPLCEDPPCACAAPPPEDPCVPGGCNTAACDGTLAGMTALRCLLEDARLNPPVCRGQVRPRRIAARLAHAQWLVAAPETPATERRTVRRVNRSLRRAAVLLARAVHRNQVSPECGSALHQAIDAARRRAAEWLLSTRERGRRAATT